MATKPRKPQIQVGQTVKVLFPYLLHYGEVVEVNGPWAKVKHQFTDEAHTYPVDRLEVTSKDQS